MIRFSLVWLTSTTRWVAPLSFYSLWLALAIAGRGSVAETAVFLFPIHILISFWVTVLLGSLDDKPHRELLSVAAGGPAVLLRHRALAALALVTLVSLASFLVAMLIDGSPGVRAAGIALGLLASGNFFGVACGHLLHPPVVEEVGLAVVAGPAYLMVIMILPPVQWCLRNSQVSSAVRPGLGMLALLASSLLLGLASLGVGQFLVHRHSL